MTEASPKRDIYLKQLAACLKLFSVATIGGVAVALASDYGTAFEYPALRTGIFVHGLLFWPWYVRRAYGKRLVSTRKVLVQDDRQYGLRKDAYELSWRMNERSPFGEPNRVF